MWNWIVWRWFKLAQDCLLSINLQWFFPLQSVYQLSMSICDPITTTRVGVEIWLVYVKTQNDEACANFIFVSKIFGSILSITEKSYQWYRIIRSPKPRSPNRCHSPPTSRSFLRLQKEAHMASLPNWRRSRIIHTFKEKHTRSLMWLSALLAITLAPFIFKETWFETSKASRSKELWRFALRCSSKITNSLN